MKVAIFIAHQNLYKEAGRRFKNAHIPCILLNENDFKQSLLS
jgi:hypothetical protein